MAAAPPEYADQTRLALRTIVTEHGPEMLSRPRALSNLLADLLPDAPRIARILVAAAEDHVAEELIEHATTGMDPETATRMAASAFADTTMFPPDVCAWVVGEIALALELIPDNSAPPVSFQPPVTAATASLSRPAESGVRSSAGASQAWTAVATADRAYFDAVIADGHIDAASIEFPSDYPERRFELTGTQMRIGRRSASRNLEPEIDLAGPPTDPGISHLHAVLIAADDGRWSVLDPGSSNGTRVNGRELASGERVLLHDGDRVCLGAWTALTFHSG
jgi:hypothetical protein